MTNIINANNLTSVVNQSGGYLSSGYKLHKNVVNFNLKKSKYLKSFKHSGGAVRSGTEIRPFDSAQTGGAVRSGTEVRTYGGNKKMKGGSVRSGTEVRTTTIHKGGSRRHRSSNKTKGKKRKTSKKTRGKKSRRHNKKVKK